MLRWVVTVVLLSACLILPRIVPVESSAVRAAILSDAAPSTMIAPADLRFAAADGVEVPSFQRHVVPILGRLGCNGRACHGSFQGQGGFRLSLFGYDFASDHQALVGNNGESRVDLNSPAESLILRKPTKVVAHKGGQLMKVGGWEYNLVSRWVGAGAPARTDTAAEFTTLQIEPREIVFAKAGQSVAVRVVATWSDGSREDVTPLCRFRTNDESMATVDETGRVTAVGPGDTHIVAFYDNGVAPVPVLLPVSDRTGLLFPMVPVPTKVDELVVGKLRKLGIVPSNLCSDEEYLRRLSFDLTGTLPAVDEVVAFAADKATDKRQKKVEELLSRPTYAAWWATKLGDYTGNSDRNGSLGGEQALNGEKSKQWYQWLYRRLADNEAYDRIVAGIVLASGRTGTQSFDEYCAEMSAYYRREKPADFAQRPTMPWFWTRRSIGNSEEKGMSLAHAFLGVNLQCAQCHKHPYDQWTKQDFEQFAAFFNGIRYGDSNRTVVKEMKTAVGLGALDEDSGTYKRKFVDLLAEGKVLPFKDLTVPQRPPGGKPRTVKSASGRVITPRLLGGEEVIASQYDDPRQPLMDWMRQPENPYFARAFVNRVWASYFHTGIIEPADDLNLANPPSNRELLDYLADGFVTSRFDIRWVHRQIANSRTYQLSWRPNESNRHDERNFSRAVLRRLPGEVAADAVRLATVDDTARRGLEADPTVGRSIGLVSGLGTGRDGVNYAAYLFGKSPRAINCDCERSSEPSLLQTAYLRNDEEVLRLLDAKDGWLKQIGAAKDRDLEGWVRQAYLRTLSRQPSVAEMATAKRHVGQQKDLVAGMRDLMWALLNTKEFILNR